MVGWYGFPSRRAQEVGGPRDELTELEPRRANPGDAEVDRGEKPRRLEERSPQRELRPRPPRTDDAR